MLCVFFPGTTSPSTLHSAHTVDTSVDRLTGPVVKVSASRAVDPGFDSR